MKKQLVEVSLNKFIGQQLSTSQANQVKGGTGTNPEDIPSIVVVDSVII